MKISDYPTEKTTIVFLDPPTKACNIRKIFMEQPETYVCGRELRAEVF